MNLTKYLGWLTFTFFFLLHQKKKKIHQIKLQIEETTSITKHLIFCLGSKTETATTSIRLLTELKVQLYAKRKHIDQRYI